MCKGKYAASVKEIMPQKYADNGVENMLSEDNVM
jgi:hypothetical protein